MAEIHGIVYLIVGLFLAIGSYVLNSQAASYRFALFLLIGVGMIILGIVKLMRKKADKKVVVQHNPTQQFVKYCSRCGAALQGFQQFCHSCGSRLFHRR